MEITAERKEELLKTFMNEFFPFNDFKKIGFFTAEMRGNYQAQAEKVCRYFGFDSVYEYGTIEVSCHITFAEGKRPEGEPFITRIESIY